MPPKRPRPLLPSKHRTSKRSCTSSDTSHAEKPHTCDQCDKSYVDSSRLGRHKRDNHGETTKFYCEYCSRPFQRREGLKKHINNNSCPSSIAGLAQRQKMLHDVSTTLSSIEQFLGTISPVVSSSADTNTSLTPARLILNPTLIPTISDNDNLSNDTLGIPTSASLEPFFAPSTEEQILDAYISAGKRRRRLNEAASYLKRVDSLLTAPPEFTGIVYGEPKPPSPSEMSWYNRKWLEQRERDKSRCTSRYSSPRPPFPPTSDCPPPQDLEDLVLQQSRSRRRLRLMASFRSTHCKFGNQTLEQTWVASEDCNSRMACHQFDHKQAWKDGVGAAQRLLSGDLPRELHSVLGVAQLASAIRSAMDDVDTPAASEETFLSDLNRWRHLLPSDSHAAFDCYADMLWDDRPPSDLAREVPHDTETLVYFQDLLATMLSYIEYSPPKQHEIKSTLSQSGQMSNPSPAATRFPSLLSPKPNEGLSGVVNLVEAADQDELQQVDIAELSLYSAGAIFALILAFLLLYTSHFSVQVLCLCFITITEPPTHDGRDRLDWSQHASLLANCRLLELLIQQLGMDRILVAETPGDQFAPSTLLGGLQWQQLIARCFDDTAEDSSVISDVR